MVKAAYSDRPHMVVGKTVEANSKPVELFRGRGHFNKSHVITAETENFKNRLDISWIKAASEQYHLSSDPSDYVLVDVPIVSVDIPNRNLQAFPFEEVSSFDPQAGRMVFQTFIGKPTHIEHQNQDWTQAKGIHLDATLSYVPKYDTWKINVLTAWDRTKDPELVNGILSGKRNKYSMGSMVRQFIDSVTGKVVTPDDRRGDIVKGRLRYHLCTGSTYFETSNVGDPADLTANGDRLGEI